MNSWQHGGGGQAWIGCITECGLRHLRVTKRHCLLGGKARDDGSNKHPLTQPILTKET